LKGEESSFIRCKKKSEGGTRCKQADGREKKRRKEKGGKLRRTIRCNKKKVFANQRVDKRWRVEERAFE